MGSWWTERVQFSYFFQTSFKQEVQNLFFSLLAKRHVKYKKHTNSADLVPFFHLEGHERQEVNAGGLRGSAGFLLMWHGHIAVIGFPPSQCVCSESIAQLYPLLEAQTETPSSEPYHNLSVQHNWIILRVVTFDKFSLNLASNSL